MSTDNKRNLQFFEASSMRELFDSMQAWQKANNLRLLSVSIQRDDDKFYCIALTNPSEVVIVSPDGQRAADVYANTSSNYHSGGYTSGYLAVSS